MISAISVIVFLSVISAISGAITQEPKMSTISVVNVALLFITLIRHGNESAFSKWVLTCVDVSPSKGYLWFDTGGTPEPEDVDYTDSVLESYPTITVLIILLTQLALMYHSITGGEFSSQVFGLIYDIGGGWILVAERIRSGPYLTADIHGNAKAYLESIWGFSLLGTGFALQIIAILL
jgi:hypothetical protein